MAEKIKKFKFTKPTAKAGETKDANWFKKLNSNCRNGDDDEAGAPDRCAQLVNPRTGLTKEDERRINRELIPQYIQQQEELKPEFEQLKHVKEELK